MNAHVSPSLERSVRIVALLSLLPLAVSCATTPADKTLEKGVVFGVLLGNANYLEIARLLREGKVDEASGLVDEALAASIVELEQLQGTKAGRKYSNEIERQTQRARAFRDSSAN